ncbi:spore germination protein [Bacillus shivajii]|uniref:spore germination protein n=1 Tax=Bacillus shivajii TaxID=1983719 RepID=UPI001CFBEC94|nr:spore germination protein [Bacillus shivajii]UCZ51505.1 spore germination protein [Bacillus shivajii]
MSKKPMKTYEKTWKDIIHECSQSDDFIIDEVQSSYQTFHISYFETVVDEQRLQSKVIKNLKEKKYETLEDIYSQLSFEEMKIISSPDDLEEGLITGNVLIKLKENDEHGLLIVLSHSENRIVSVPEVEYSVIGPKEAFVENLDVNINLIRKRIPTTDFVVKKLKVGTLTHTDVAVVYLKSIANEEDVRTALQRIEEIDYDEIEDSSYLSQFIEDNKNSPFPQTVDTERPDRVAGVLSQGKIAILVNGSPAALTAPTTLIEFFSAFEDYYIAWHMASVFRLIRLCAVLFSVFATPIYVAVITFHVEMIPRDLMATLILTREQVPFPPIIEALFLELTIELLREAGARLPTKVGQTIGIVGGIVIGTAAVEAGLTSNVLLIIVALAALASFTTPIYRIGNTIRLMRFPFLIIAQLWGLIGISLLMTFTLIHLISLKSLGRPYLAPIYPPIVKDLRDSFIRLPFSFQSKRPLTTQTKDETKFSVKDAKMKNDIDHDIQ